jgi:DNA polymerase (family X)
MAMASASSRGNARYGDGFRIFKGIESDILTDGSLDYPDEILSRFDFVVASVHGQFRKDRASQTERILRAVANPHTTILGHMTGRQLLRSILSACAEHGVAVEINANPWRLDLDWRWHQKAIDLGCWFSVNPARIRPRKSISPSGAWPWRGRAAYLRIVS